MGFFETFYAGPIQHPILLWAAAVAAGLFCAAWPGIPPAMRRYGFVLTALSLADAWLTSNHVYGVGSLDGALASAIPLFFVLAGDYRYLLLLVASGSNGELEINARRLVVALALTLIVPLASQSVVSSLPENEGGARILFLIYELMFVALVVALRRWHPGLRERSWLEPVHRFVLLYYGLWATADAIILATSSDLGFGLRVVPNLLYYGGLIAMIGWAASKAPHDSEAVRR